MPTPLEVMLNACHAKLLDKSILNKDLVELIDAYWYF